MFLQDLHDPKRMRKTKSVPTITSSTGEISVQVLSVSSKTRFDRTRAVSTFVTAADDATQNIVNILEILCIIIITVICILYCSRVVLLRFDAQRRRTAIISRRRRGEGGTQKREYLY